MLRLRRSRKQKAAPIHWRTLFKGAAIIVLPPAMVLMIYSVYNLLTFNEAILGIGAIFLLSIIFVRPYIANLAALTRYVDELSQDKKAQAPDLTFLNNVEELSAAVERLNHSWNDRKNQLETLLAESKILIDSLPDILVMLDEQMNVVRTNSTAQLAFGRFYTETIQTIISKPTIQKALKQVMETRRGIDVECVLEDPIYRDYIVHIERLPILSPGGIAVILTMHDVTEIRRTEQSFADFVANASHEIRTPLTTLTGFIETLRGPARDDEEARDKFLKIMAEQAERMTKLVKDLLSLSKIEKRSQTPPTDPVVLSLTMRAAKNSLSWEAKKKNIRLSMKFERRLPSIIGDEGELEQVFYNLVSNAIKYSPENSVVNITGSRMPNRYTRDKWLRGAKEVIEISVRDQGEGIAAEHLPRLTERFYRVDKARSREVGGTGLGLAIVKQILERHHGMLEIESEPGKGSTFTVILALPDDIEQ
ncbi:MAG: two-component sensor histidine kinase [Proteobacteria bacterium]|nr:two-component sensor histidine kinase [Pseudomonadota bacterium]